LKKDLIFFELKEQILLKLFETVGKLKMEEYKQYEAGTNVVDI